MGTLLRLSGYALVERVPEHVASKPVDIASAQEVRIDIPSASSTGAVGVAAGPSGPTPDVVRENYGDLPTTNTVEPCIFGCAQAEQRSHTSDKGGAT